LSSDLRSLICNFLDVLLVLRSSAEYYPPTVNQANLLAERGLRVGMIDLSADGAVDAVHSSIRRWRVHRMWNSKREAPYPIWKRWTNWFRFFRACQSVIRLSRPRVVIAYDTLGSIFVKPDPQHYRTVYHFHELTGPERQESFGPRRARLKAAERSRHADLVVFSDAHRARIFQGRAGLSALPRVVMNCPRRLEQVPCSPLRRRLALDTQPTTLNLQPATQLVCYLGSVGADQGLVEAAASMKHWPTDARLVLIGPASDTMKGSIHKAAAAAPRAAERVIFLGAFPHHEALALAAGADLGISLIQPNNESWLYSAGAINKRFEYMALGLPQVTNNGPGVSEIVEANQAGLCVEARNPEAIGSTIRRLLDDAALRRRLSESARRQHLDRYNYEVQFAEVADWVRARCTADGSRTILNADKLTC
jgi:glycosyltransferase involved in cell wall biosynthesis